MRQPLNAAPPHHPLASILEARSLALIGASSDPGKLSGRTLLYLQKQKFSGQIYPINRSRKEILGVPCYNSVLDVGKQIDVALVFTQALEVITALNEGIRAGIKSFIVFASGFAEAGAAGADLQQELAAFARTHDIDILGPNCVGVMNSRTGLMATFSGAVQDLEIIPGGFSFASQSGALASYWLELTTRLGIGFSKWISTGNEADLTMADAVSYLSSDRDTKVIGLYLEGITDAHALGQSFTEATRSGKVVFALKAGATAAGAAAALSHTGAVSGSDDVWDAFFAQHGVVRCVSMTDMISLAKLPLMQPGSWGNRPALLSVSGGAAALLTDEAVRRGFEVADFSARSKALLADFLPAYAALQNPIDVTGAASSDPRIFSGCLEVLLGDAEHDAVVVFLSLSRGGVVDHFVEALLTHRTRFAKPLLVVSFGTLPENRLRLEAAGIPVYSDIPEVIHALAVARQLHFQLPRRDANGPGETETSGQVLPRIHGAATRVLPEHSGAELIGTSLPVVWPRQLLVADKQNFTALHSDLRYPLVAKLQSAALPHKTEHGAIKLGLRDAVATTDAIDALLEKAHQLGVPCDGVLLQEMFAFEHELLVGLREDAVFGPILVVGRGGINVEADRDIAIVLPPIDAVAVECALLKLRYAPTLQHGRGKAPVDIGMLAGRIAAIAQWYCVRPHIIEIEINPLAIARDGSAMALDVLVEIVDDSGR